MSIIDGKCFLDFVHPGIDDTYIYEKDGRIYPVPYHGAKELGKGLQKKIEKEMGLK